MKLAVACLLASNYNTRRFVCAFRQPLADLCVPDPGVPRSNTIAESLSSFPRRHSRNNDRLERCPCGYSGLVCIADSFRRELLASTNHADYRTQCQNRQNAWLWNSRTFNDEWQGNFQACAIVNGGTVSVTVVR
jgi:hypothetical protein